MGLTNYLITGCAKHINIILHHFRLVVKVSVARSLSVFRAAYQYYHVLKTLQSVSQLVALVKNVVSLGVQSDGNRS